MGSTTTKDTILVTALKIFLEKGFAGGSISQIAKAAGINQSLIYHYYKSKEDLWSEVKKYCVDEITHDVKSIRHDTLAHFIDDLVEVRFSVYARASMRMLTHWQALEPDTSKFYGHDGKPHPLFDINEHIVILQHKKLVRSDQNAQVLSGVIFGLVSYAFFDYANAFDLSAQQRMEYKKLIREILIQALKQRNDINANQ